MNLPEVVSRETWDAARKKLLLAEKALTRSRDALNAERRRLPMVRIEKDYVFEDACGKVSLRDLFEDRRQLIVYHMMSVKCPGCALLVDNIGHLAHLHARDTTLVVVSRARWPALNAFWQRMGWNVPCYSSSASDFNDDFQVTRAAGEVHGVSVFLRDGDGVFHTYSTYDRGTDILNGTYNYLDLTALGRQEEWEEPKGRASALGAPAGSERVRYHDEYEE